MKAVRAFVVVSVCLAAFTAAADAVSTMRRFTGYTIVGVMTISGYRDENGKRGDDFQGCEWGRRIIFNDSKVLTCAGYSYSYSYRPDALVITNGSDWKMLVGDDVYDMRR